MVYKLPHIPAPGETPTAPAYSMGLDGKGATSRLPQFIFSEPTHPTGHVIINAAKHGENANVILAGANG